MPSQFVRGPGPIHHLESRADASPQVYRPIRFVYVLLVTVLTGILLRAFSFKVAGLDWDESLYIVMAQRWLRGDLPYVNIWDQHPPGLPAIFALMQMVISDGVLAARVAALLAVSLTSALLFASSDRFVKNRLAGYLASLLYLVVMARPDGLAGNTEVFNNLLVTAAAYFLLPEFLKQEASIRHGRVLFAAFLLGVGLQIKYVVFPEATLLCSAVLIRYWSLGIGLRRILLTALLSILAGLLPTVAVVLYFLDMDALQQFLDANFRANVDYLDVPLSFATALSRLRFGLLPISSFAVWALVTVILLQFYARSLTERWFGTFLVVWLIAVAVDIALPLKFWKHYFNALLPPLSLAAGLGCVLVGRAFPRAFALATGVALAVTMAPIVVLLVKHAPDSRSIGRLNVPEAVAEQIQAGGTDGRDVYLFNYDPIVYAYAHAKPPTRYVLGIELADFSVSSGALALQEVNRLLMSTPKWIVVAEPSPYDFGESIWKRLQAILRGYQLYGEWSESDYIQPPIQVRLYRRMGDGDVKSDIR
jgi:hypothetical protein